VSVEGIEEDPQYVEAIMNWRKPKPD